VLEQLLLLGTGVVLGVPTGLIAARLAMPVIPEFADHTPITLDYSPKALPTLIKAATAKDLKTALTTHLAETKEHVVRLERVFKLMQMPVRGKKCEGMQHVIAEGSEMIAECEEDATRDALERIAGFGEEGAHFRRRILLHESIERKIT